MMTSAPQEHILRGRKIRERDRFIVLCLLSPFYNCPTRIIQAATLSMVGGRSNPIADHTQSTFLFSLVSSNMAILFRYVCCGPVMTFARLHEKELLAQALL